MRAHGLPIRTELSADEIRRRARREPDRATSCRMSALVNALDGISWEDTARLADMERQALRDAVVRYNAEGYRWAAQPCRTAAPGKLDLDELQALAELILGGPDPEADESSSWTPPELCRMIEAR